MCVGRKKIIQESIKPDPDSSENNSKSVWNLEPIGIGSTIAPHITEFPSFVLKAVKVKFITKSLFVFSFYIVFIYKIKKTD